MSSQTRFIWFTLLLFLSQGAYAQNRLTIAGVQGSVGIGYTEYTVLSPKTDIRIDRGMYATAAGEKAFNVANLYLTISLGYMDASGTANYNYSNLSSTTNYSVSDVQFKSRMMELGLGLKMKLIDNYWFRPYVEGGGLGSWNEVNYTSKTQELRAQGPDYKSKDTMMGQGFYGEAGVEVQFSDRLGVKIAARFSETTTKKMQTLNDQALRYRGETYYLSALMGF